MKREMIRLGTPSGFSQRSVNSSIFLSKLCMAIVLGKFTIVWVYTLTILEDINKVREHLQLAMELQRIYAHAILHKFKRTINNCINMSFVLLLAFHIFLFQTKDFPKGCRQLIDLSITSRYNQIIVPLSFYNVTYLYKYQNPDAICSVAVASKQIGWIHLDLIHLLNNGLKI